MKLLVTVALLPQCDVDKLQVSMQVVLVMQSSWPYEPRWTLHQCYDFDEQMLNDQVLWPQPYISF
jgi:hypothetical protein